MATLSMDGIAVHYRESGSGDPVVLLHGGGSSGAQWKGVCGLLADRFRTITIDHYGHGGTAPWPGPPEARSHDAEAELVRGVIERVGEPAHLVGHSYGGGVALRMALLCSGPLRSLTLLEPIALSILRHRGEHALARDYEDFARSFIRDVAAGDVEGAWERFLDGNGEPGTWERTPPEARAKFVAMTPAIASGWYANLNHDTAPDDCGAIALPTLLLHGERTKPHFRRITELLAEHIPAARLQVLPGAGHMSPLTHPQAVAEALAAHLDEATAAEA
jgi:pimeloyl-ACP methyl ester carboxylesterase